MNLEKFKASSLAWNEIVNPKKAIADQLLIVESEKQELSDASIREDQLSECADVVWTLTFLEKLYLDARQFQEGDECRRSIHTNLYYHSPKHFKACSISNYSKLLKDVHKANKEALKVAENPRYTDVKVASNQGYFWLVGNDHQNPENVQVGKLLKPTNYISKEEALIKM